VGVIPLKSDPLASNSVQKMQFAHLRSTGEISEVSEIPRIFIKFLVELTSFALFQAPLGHITAYVKVLRHSNVKLSRTRPGPKPIVHWHWPLYMYDVYVRAVWPINRNNFDQSCATEALDNDLTTESHGRVPQDAPIRSTSLNYPVAASNGPSQDWLPSDRHAW